MKRAAGPILGLVLLAYPLVFSTPFAQRLGALVLLYAVGASAWNIVGGYAGLISVGHAVFFGCGAYGALASYQYLGLPPIGGLPIGVVVSVMIAALIGVPTLRLSGHYFSMATIAVAELVRLIVSNTEWLGGAQGLSGPPVPRTLFDLSFISALPYYYLFLAVLTAVLVLTWQMERSRIGYYLRAIRDSERAARSLGAAAPRYKLYAYMRSFHGSGWRALCRHVRLHRPGIRARYPGFRQNADHGCAWRRRAALRPSCRRGHSRTAGGNIQ